MDIPHRLELLRLLSALCDGQLENGEQDRLEELLAGDAEARQVYLRYVDMHSRLLVHPGLVDEVVAAGGVRAETADSALARLISPHALARERPGQRWRRGVRWFVPYAAVAAAAVAATLLIQVTLFRPQPSASPIPVAATETPVPPLYVATLTQAADAEWEDSAGNYNPGSRFLPGEVRLKKGIARIHFDSGADLVMEGPATVRLESIAGAALVLGKVVFRAEDTDLPFTLSTPTSLLVESGVACGIEVNKERDEIHVFEGAVQRLSKDADDDDEPHLLAAGEARRFSSTGSGLGEATDLDPARFELKFPEPIRQPADLTDGLLAYEPFDYQDAEALKNRTANGGVGWDEAWQSYGGWVVKGRGGSAGTLHIASGLSRPGAAGPSPGGMLQSNGSANYRRHLQTPIRLDQDGIYYISLLLQRTRFDDGRCSLAIALRSTADEEQRERERDRDRRGGRFGRGPGHFGGFEMPKQPYFGLSGNRPFTESSLYWHNQRGAVPLDGDDVCLLVAKIAASADNADQVFLRIYAPDEPVHFNEPGNWTVIGNQFQSSAVLDRLDISLNSWDFGKQNNNRQAIDEIRVGTTWAAVVGPWVAPPTIVPVAADSAPAAGGK